MGIFEKARDAYTRSAEINEARGNHRFADILLGCARRMEERLKEEIEIIKKKPV